MYSKDGARIVYALPSSQIQNDGWVIRLLTNLFPLIYQICSLLPIKYTIAIPNDKEADCARTLTSVYEVINEIIIQLSYTGRIPIF